MDELNELDNVDFFDEDYLLEDEPPKDQISEEVTEEPQGDQQDDQPTDDILTAFLQSKGINPNSVKMQNEDGDTEEINFNDLSREEQLQILNYNPANSNDQEPEDLGLAEDEEKLLGILRNNNMTVQDYLNAYRRHVIEEYQAQNPVQQEERFDVDQYSDEELFIADLKDKVPDLTEEEAVQELELQQQNPDLFKKKVDGLRKSYQDREKQIREYEEQQAQAAQAQQAKEFESVIVDTIQRNNSIDLGDTSLELSEDDMNEIASFILDSDPAGVRYIAKALNDPKMLVEMAWWALKGHDALNQVTQYYKKQITEARRSAKTSQPAKQKPKTVVTKKPSSKNNVNGESDLFDQFV